MILDAIWVDLKNPNSINKWRPSYDNLKEVIRDIYFEESDWENFLASEEKDWIHAYS